MHVSVQLAKKPMPMPLQFRHTFDHSASSILKFTTVFMTNQRHTTLKTGQRLQMDWRFCIYLMTVILAKVLSDS